jgi:tetratricopeptide (TPR) repeat protein
MPRSCVQPHIFLPALATCHRDPQMREAAVRWYALYERNDARLMLHTAKLALHHPQSLEIGLLNRRTFVQWPRFRDLIEERLRRGVVRSGRPGVVLFNAAQVALGGIVEDFDSPEDRTQWLRYLDLPDDFDVVATRDADAGSRAANYLSRALSVPVEREFMDHMIIPELMKLLVRLGRSAEAIAVGEKGSLVDPESLLALGDALLAQQRCEKAAAAYDAALIADASGYEGGGHVSIAAHLALGRMAQHRGDTEKATAQLRAAIAIPRCNHCNWRTIQKVCAALRAVGMDGDAEHYRNRISAERT